jgi:hypothetical protein
MRKIGIGTSLVAAAFMLLCVPDNTATELMPPHTYRLIMGRIDIGRQTAQSALVETPFRGVSSLDCRPSGRLFC